MSLDRIATCPKCGTDIPCLLDEYVTICPYCGYIFVSHNCDVENKGVNSIDELNSLQAQVNAIFNNFSINILKLEVIIDIQEKYVNYPHSDKIEEAVRELKEQLRKVHDFENCKLHTLIGDEMDRKKENG